MREDFERFNGTNPLHRDWLNSIAEAVETTLRLTVAPPLSITRLGHGILIRIDDENKSIVQGAIIQSAWAISEEGAVVEIDLPESQEGVEYWMGPASVPTFVIAQQTNLMGEGPTGYVWLKLGTPYTRMCQRSVQEAEGCDWMDDLSDVGFPRLWQGQVIGWVEGPGISDGEYVGPEEDILIDGYVVAYAGKDGAVPAVAINSLFWACLYTETSPGIYNFSQEDIIGGVIPKTGEAREMNYSRGLTGKKVLIRQFDGCFRFYGTADHDLNEGPGIDVIQCASDESWKISVDLAELPGLEFVPEGDTGELKALVDDTRGLDIDVDGIFINLADAADSSLGFDVNGKLTHSLQAVDQGTFITDIVGENLAWEDDVHENLFDKQGHLNSAIQNVLMHAGPGVHLYTGTTLNCSTYLDSTGHILGWYEPDSTPPLYMHWCSPWGRAEPGA